MFQWHSLKIPQNSKYQENTQSARNYLATPILNRTHFPTSSWMPEAVPLGVLGHHRQVQIGPVYLYPTFPP